LYFFLLSFFSFFFFSVVALRVVMSRRAWPCELRIPCNAQNQIWRNFIKRILGQNEKTKVTKLFPTILDSDAIPHKQDQVFDNLEPLVDGLPEAKPDSFDGTSSAQMDSHVFQELSRFIVPSTWDSVPVLPNFALDASGSGRLSKRRALYNGTLSPRAIHQTQYCLQEPLFDGNAYTISVTYYDDILRFCNTP